MTWGHDALQEDLAAHLRGSRDRVVWTNMQMGPSGSPRPDVYTMPKSFSRFTPLSYEIKISTADFRRDVTSGKWQSYLKFSAGVIFAVPAGLIKKDDVPSGCGLIVRHDEVWRTVKGPTLKATDNLPLDCWIKLMIDGLDRQGHEPQPRSASPWEAQKAIRKRYGDGIAQALSDRDIAESNLRRHIARTEQSIEVLLEAERTRAANARTHVEDELKVAREGKIELCRALGIPENSSRWALQTAAAEAATRLTGDGEVARLRNILRAVERAVMDSVKPLPVLIFESPPGSHGDTTERPA